MVCKWLPVQGKLKFYFLEISGIKKNFFFDLWLVESVDVETVDCIQADFEDIARLIPDHNNKATITVKEYRNKASHTKVLAPQCT